MSKISKLLINPTPNKMFPDQPNQDILIILLARVPKEYIQVIKNTAEIKPCDFETIIDITKINIKLAIYKGISKIQIINFIINNPRPAIINRFKNEELLSHGKPL